MGQNNLSNQAINTQENLMEIISEMESQGFNIEQALVSPKNQTIGPDDNEIKVKTEWAKLMN